MRPAITRAPGDAENNCPSYMHLSAENSTPCSLEANESEIEGVVASEIAKEYGISFYIFKTMLKAEKVPYKMRSRGKLYDECHADEIAARIFALGKLVTARHIRWKTLHSLPEIKAFFDARNITPQLSLPVDDWYKVEDFESYKSFLREKSREAFSIEQKMRSEKSRAMLEMMAPEGYLIISVASQKYNKSPKALHGYIARGVGSIKQCNRLYINEADLVARIEATKKQRAETMLANQPVRGNKAPAGYIFMSDWCKAHGEHRTTYFKAVGSGKIESIKIDSYVYVLESSINEYYEKRKAVKLAREAKKCGKIERLSLLA